MVVTLRLPSDVLERVDEAVAASGYRFRDRSEFLRHTISEAVPPADALNLGKRLKGVQLPSNPTVLVMEIDGERVEYVAKSFSKGEGERERPRPTTPRFERRKR